MKITNSSDKIKIGKEEKAKKQERKQDESGKWKAWGCKRERERERELYFNEISKDRGYVAFIRDG